QLMDDQKQAREQAAEEKPFPMVSLDADTRSVEIKGEPSLFYLVSQAGFDRTLPEGTVREGLEIDRSFLDDAGNKIEQFEQGKEVTVQLKIRALGKPVNNIAVIDLLPGGFEVIRSSVPRTAYGWEADYVDVREDRVVFYGSFDTSVKELTYRAKLTAAGSFIVPPAYAESMYDRSIRARGLHGRFEVSPSQ
ncbi:MAG: hypothetical protein JRC99_11320, partial [Deltaproteobacteria bacterium]|nr:hypothetical protein [Deltaproteobacteria bacterium]